MDEKAIEISNRFKNSWIETEIFIHDITDNNIGFERLKAIQQFVMLLKQNGEDQFFRMGTSVHDLIISRSVSHGLRLDQKYIKIAAFDTKFEVTLRDGFQIYRQYMVDSLDDDSVTKLLKTLKDTLID